MKLFHERISLFGPISRIGFFEKFVTAPIIVTDLWPRVFSFRGSGSAGCIQVFLSLSFPDHILVDDSSAKMTYCFCSSKLAINFATERRSDSSYLDFVFAFQYTAFGYAYWIPILL